MIAPLRRSVRLGLGLALALGIPAGAEHAAVVKIGRALAGDRSDAGRGVDLHAAGLSLGPLARQLGSARVHADAAHLRPARWGPVLELDGLVAHVRAEAPVDGPAGTASDPSAPESEPPPPPRPGMRFRIVARGQVRIEGPGGLALELSDPDLELGADGTVSVHATGRLLRDQTPVAQLHQLSARGTSLRARTWQLAGRVALRPDRPFEIEGLVARGGADVDVRAGGGSAHVVVRRGERPGARVEADGLPLDLLPPNLLEHPRGRIVLDGARTDGVVEIRRAGTATVARFDRVVLEGPRIEAPALSREPVRLLRSTIDGTLALDRGTADARLALSHADARVDLTGAVSRERVEVRAHLHPIDCQALVDALPPGLAPVLAGMIVEGRTAGELHLSVDPRRLPATAPTDPLHPPEPPGKLEVELPLLESCRVVRDAPGIDVEALAGPHRHRFVAGDGTEQVRILDPSAPGYVPLAAAPRLAQAFVLLEDSRFWVHDGFDREQMERALWLNLRADGFSRGASTITQQTARNLWLGHDRTLGRKLQEAVLAARLEQVLPKRRILEIYMNIIELGPGVHGIGDASRYHFGRTPAQLNLLETLHLAALAPAPVGYSRRFADGHVDAAWRVRLAEQVERMRIHGLIDRPQATAARALGLGLRDHGGSS